MSSRRQRSSLAIGDVLPPSATSFRRQRSPPAVSKVLWTSSSRRQRIPYIENIYLLTPPPPPPGEENSPMLIDKFLVELYKSHIENASPYPQETTRPTYWAGRGF